ncbi:MAG: septum formation protein Maf [Alphaproteobacteria bacterium]|nr:MAG: septum formation protein Maf [Alphaproteobacteria bacterium]
MSSMILPDAPAVVLASASATRRRLLALAGLLFPAEAADLDEAGLKAALQSEKATARQAAETLAELKAQRVARHHPGAPVIGADQILDCEGRWFDKPRDRAAAAAQLRHLSGRAHDLVTGTCVVRDGVRLWHHTEAAHMVMRAFDENVLARYLDAVGDAALESVGAYQVEGPGIHLFARIDGDHFAILGLPLLPLLAFLRAHGVVP